MDLEVCVGNECTASRDTIEMRERFERTPLSHTTNKVSDLGATPRVAERLQTREYIRRHVTGGLESRDRREYLRKRANFDGLFKTFRMR